MLGVKYFSGVSLCQIYKPIILNEKGYQGVINFRRMVKVACTGCDNIAEVVNEFKLELAWKPADGQPWN